MSRALQDWAANSALGKSGFLAAFALIFLSEIGDKTFFIAGLLALKVGWLSLVLLPRCNAWASPHQESCNMLQVGRMMSFIGSTVALAIMTVISVVIGYGFKSVPDALKSSIPVGHYLSVACLVYFGVKTLKVHYEDFTGSLVMLAHCHPTSRDAGIMAGRLANT